MKFILDDDLVLEKYAKANAALIFDYDGTLCPIVASPKAAVLTPKTKRLLKELVRLYPCAVLSGRSLKDLKTKVAGIGFQALVGNHGIEFAKGKNTLSLVTRVSRWKKDLLLAIKEGRIDSKCVELESKTVSLSLHYRNHPDHKKVASQIRKVLSEFRGLRVVEGKCVFNLLPNVKKNKGTAVITLRKMLGREYAFFTGDDVTDEDAFALKNKKKILDVRVGKSQKSEARYYINDQFEMDLLLERFIELAAHTSVEAKATKSSRRSHRVRRKRS